MNFLHALHAGYSSALLRSWQSTNTRIDPCALVMPVFISQNPDALEPVPSLIDQYRVGRNKVCQYLQPLVEKKLAAVLLFGVVEFPNSKDAKGSLADSHASIVIPAIHAIKEAFPQLTVICDVCLCAYTDHGHCGILHPSDGTIDLENTLTRLADIACKFAQAGADIVAPSDMMDGRVDSIKTQLHRVGLSGRVAVMSYSAKFASSFYGPFRDAAKSAPTFGDRRCYQLPPGAKGLAIRAAIRDANEGADIIMVKPGTPYLDVLSQLKQELPNHPLAVYHVSGEYAMLMHAANAGALNLKDAALELMTAFRRAGASIIITYLTPYLLDLNLDDQFK